MRLIPNFINPTNTSNAEKHLFELMRTSDKLNEWICLHSLGVSNHISKREGEIDFLLVGPLGIFVIEVKGGRITRKDGKWYFIDRYDRMNQKNESPFNQARTALYSIRSDITERFGRNMYSHVFGYGVMFPDIVFEERSPEWDQEIVFDGRDVAQDISNYITRLSSYWDSKQRSRNRLSSKEIKEITDYLRGDFEIVRSIAASIDESEREIIDITDEQYSLLDALESNPRTIFLGAAGTGKTLLAIEKARRNALKGIKTLFVCYNRLLADYIGGILEDDLGDSSSYLTVSSIHSYLYRAIKNHAKENLLISDDPQKLYDQIYPKVYLGLDDNDRFEEVIVDEAQDILSDDYLGVIDALVEGGLDNGRWLICMDQENQDIYHRVDRTSIQNLFNKAANFKLTVNCRNTKSIAQQVKLVSMIDAGTVARASGAPVKYLWYKDITEQSHKVSELVANLLSDGIKPEDITVLSPLRGSASLAGSGRLRIAAPIFNIDTRKTPLKINGHIGYTTISSYKGLENKVIIITDISDIGSAASIVNYVAFTRARSHLVVSLPKELKSELSGRVSSIIGAEQQ